jgi:hypothetical protein
VALLDPTGAHWLDDPPDLTCKENTRPYPVDVVRLSCKQELEVFHADDCPGGLIEAVVADDAPTRPPPRVVPDPLL